MKVKKVISTTDSFIDYEGKEHKKIMQEEYREYGRSLSVANSAKTALGNLKQLYLR